MIKDRIREIINHENISFSKFADMVGIQRSGVSHILSGRNNPGLEVIQKILESFSYVNTDWLITGKGEMLIENSNAKILDKSTDNVDVTNLFDNPEILNLKSEKHIDTGSKSKKIANSQELKSGKEIDSIIFIYSDSTFKEFKNSK